MANTYFDNSDPGTRFQAGTTAEGEAVDEKFDAVATGLAEVEKDTRRAVKVPFETGMTSQEFDATALQRRNRVLGFDTEGNLALVSGFFNRGDWQQNTDYFLNDVVRDPTTTNLYVLIVRKHNSGTTKDFTDTSIWYLAIDADTVRVQKNLAIDARNKAEQWATSLDAVEGVLRGARFYALRAQGDEAATRAYRDEVQAAESRVEGLEASAASAEGNAAASESAAQLSAQAAGVSESNAQSAETTAVNAAASASTDASTASQAATDADTVATRINDTTTMDFLNFEISGPDLIAHFAGYSDEANFSINAAGELEVTL